MGKKAEKRKDLRKFFILFLVFSSFFPFIQLLKADFVAWDDEIYVTTNAKTIKGLTIENIKWAFSTTYFGFYYPITWLSHQLDVTLFGLNPMGHHFTNMLLHTFNTLLLFTFLIRGGIDEIKSFIMSAIFSVHPLNVESVGWISERKNLLAFFFFFIALNLYLNYIKTPSFKNLFLTLFAYLLSLMSKSVTVTFFIVIFLIDIFPLKRVEASLDFIKRNLKKIIAEKFLFMIPVPIFTFLTIYAQKKINALTTFETLPFSQRIAGAILAYLRYIYQFLFPIKLTAFYPHLRDNYSPLLLVISVISLLLIFAFSIYKLKESPQYFCGFAYFFY